MFFVVFMFPGEYSSILPLIAANPMHVRVDPFSPVFPAVHPCVDSNSFDHIVVPIPVVLTSVVPLVESNSMFGPLKVGALVGGAVRPSLLTVAMLDVILPLSLVLIPILMDIQSKTTCLVVAPVTLIIVSV